MEKGLILFAGLSVFGFVLRAGILKNTLTADAHAFLPRPATVPKRMLQEWPNFYYYTYYGYDDANIACGFYDEPLYPSKWPLEIKVEPYHFPDALPQDLQDHRETHRC